MYRNVHLGGKAGDTDACGPVAERMRDILCLRAASMTPCVSSLCQSAVNDCTHKTAHTLYGHSEKPRERSPEMAASLLCRILLYGRCAAGTDVSVHSRGGQQRRVRPWHPRGQPRLPTGCVCRRTEQMCCTCAQSHMEAECMRDACMHTVLASANRASHRV